MVSVKVQDGAYDIGIVGNDVSKKDSKSIFLHLGKNLGKYGVFYEEFLKNRDTSGIHDRIYLALQPKPNSYRLDRILSDLSADHSLLLSIAAFFYTHSRLDHCDYIEDSLRKTFHC